MEFTKAEFYEWYKRHEGHLRGYTLHEVCMLALACGFKMEGLEVNEWLQRSKRLMRLWESPFYRKWVNVWMYQNGRDTEEDYHT